MKDVYYKIIFGILIPALAVAFSLYGIGPILKKWRNKIKLHIEKDQIKDIKDSEVKKEIIEQRKKALIQAILIESRSFGLSFLTRAASLIELVAFSGLTLLVLFRAESILEEVKFFGAFLGGWLGIKVLVSHSAWSDPYVGKGYYYISLFGTLINVITAVAVGFFLYYFVF